MTGKELAEELETSLRTIYRDMAELIMQRVPIRGEAGTGYVLQPGYDMPPLMLTTDELEAAVLGARWVAARGDARLVRGAEDLIAKLSSAVPLDLQPVIVDSGLVPISFRKRPEDSFDVALVREAIRAQKKMDLGYADEAGNVTRRIVWPFLIVYADDIRMMCAWCELRQGFRHFRTDRVRRIERLEARFPQRVARLRKDWEAERAWRRSQAATPPDSGASR
ncbi:hypothetical protein HY3_06055 [Hyphomonas pacifica]|uniref:DNA-binding protein n=1 Tax=Hyphomonas pacifica TaxID=1280941 RepID=A0A062TY79_9PROT|nr:hypothetical protein HY2_05085 [Hyphomonas pacifica]RAN30380.1 hypothetical protein HY3_06055 [Hyphomonas pacifica]RAN31766.1 hypothetical protein HY11_06145 [Hyphomonas pacifica]